MDTCEWCGQETSISQDCCSRCGSMLSGSSPEVWAASKPVIESLTIRTHRTR